MKTKKSPLKKLVGVVCVLHGTWDWMLNCPICDGYRAQGQAPACPGGCGTARGQCRRFAFGAVVHTSFGKSGFCVGRADEGTDGYTLVPSAGMFDSFEAAQERANKWNKRAGLLPHEAAMIVAGTMRAGNVERRIARLGELIRRGVELLKEEAGGGECMGDIAKDWIEEALEEAKP